MTELFIELSTLKFQDTHPICVQMGRYRAVNQFLTAVKGFKTLTINLEINDKITRRFSSVKWF